MRFLKKDDGTSNFRGASAAPARAIKPAKGVAGADDIKLAQDTVEAIANALKSGADQQEIAAKRLSGLSKAMGKMDASIRHAARLEIETERLTRELAQASAERDKKRAWAQEQSAKLANVQQDRDALRQQIETAKIEIAQLKEVTAKGSDIDARQRREIDQLTRELGGRTSRLEELVLLQQRLQDDLTTANTGLSAQTHKVRELQNAVEELTARLDDKTQSSDAALAALRDLRLEYHAAKEELVATTSRLQSLEYEQSSQTNMHSDTLKRRADEILALKTQIEQLTSQLRIKDTMGAHFDEEVGGLRQSLETERERNSVNEQRLRHQAETESRQSRAVETAKREYDALNAKFVDAMKDLDALRQVNRVQAQKLERYAEVGNAPQPRREYTPPQRQDEPVILKAVK